MLDARTLGLTRAGEVEDEILPLPLRGHARQPREDGFHVLLEEDEARLGVDSREILRAQGAARQLLVERARARDLGAR